MLSTDRPNRQKTTSQNTTQFPNGIEATPNRGQSPTYVTATCLNLQAASLIPTYGKYQLKRMSLPLDYSHLGVE